MKAALWVYAWTWYIAEGVSLAMSEIPHHAKVGKITSSNKHQSSMHMFCLVLDQTMDMD